MKVRVKLTLLVNDYRGVLIIVLAKISNTDLANLLISILSRFFNNIRMYVATNICTCTYTIILFNTIRHVLHSEIYFTKSKLRILYYVVHVSVVKGRYIYCLLCVDLLHHQTIISRLTATDTSLLQHL